MSPPLSIKDKVASILGDSKNSTYASSLNKVSNSNNEDSNSDAKPRFYRREINSSETHLPNTEPDSKRIGTNFRIVRSPGRDSREKAANIVRINDPPKNSFTHPTSPKSNMGLLNNTLASRNQGFNRKSQLQFRMEPNDTEKVQERYGSKTSSQLGKIQEDGRENGGSQATIRQDSRDPRQGSTPRVKEHKGDMGIVEQQDTQEDEEGKEGLIYYDAEVIQYIKDNYHMTTESLLGKLQAGDKEAHEVYKK